MALATANLAVLPAEWLSEYFGLGAPRSVYDRCWLILGHAPVALDLARLLDEHATADLAATSKSLEEVNKLAHHRRLVLAIRRIEPLAHVDRATSTCVTLRGEQAEGR